MRTLLLLIAVFLTGCATRSTLISPPSIRAELLTPCPEQIAEPLTTGDQFDLARALVQATRYGRGCAAQQGALVDAVNGRDQLMDAVTKQSR